MCAVAFGLLALRLCSAAAGDPAQRIGDHLWERLAAIADALLSIFELAVALRELGAAGGRPFASPACSVRYCVILVSRT
jgi:hypothetical protein